MICKPTCWDLVDQCIRSMYSLPDKSRAISRWFKVGWKKSIVHGAQTIKLTTQQMHTRKRKYTIDDLARKIKPSWCPKYLKVTFQNPQMKIYAPKLLNWARPQNGRNMTKHATRTHSPTARMVIKARASQSVLPHQCENHPNPKQIPHPEIRPQNGRKMQRGPIHQLLVVVSFRWP